MKPVSYAKHSAMLLEKIQEPWFLQNCSMRQSKYQIIEVIRWKNSNKRKYTLEEGT